MHFQWDFQHILNKFFYQNYFLEQNFKLIFQWLLWTQMDCLMWRPELTQNLIKNSNHVKV